MDLEEETPLPSGRADLTPPKSQDNKGTSATIIPVLVSSDADPWSSESSGSFVTLQLVPGQDSLDWGELVEPGPDSEEYLRPPVHPTVPEKKVGVRLSFNPKIRRVEAAIAEPCDFLTQFHLI